MLTVTCKRCGACGVTSDAAHPHTAVLCACCPKPHDHGAAAIATGVPCRPVTVTPSGPSLLRSA